MNCPGRHRGRIGFIAPRAETAMIMMLVLFSLLTLCHRRAWRRTTTLHSVSTEVKTIILKVINPLGERRRKCRRDWVGGLCGDRRRHSKPSTLRTTKIRVESDADVDDDDEEAEICDVVTTRL